MFGRQAQFVVEDVGSGDFVMVEGPLEAISDAGEDIQLEAIPQAPGLEAEVDIFNAPDHHPRIEATQCEVGFPRDGHHTANEGGLMVEAGFSAHLEIPEMRWQNNDTVSYCSIDNVEMSTCDRLYCGMEFIVSRYA